MMRFLIGLMAALLVALPVSAQSETVTVVERGEGPTFPTVDGASIELPLGYRLIYAYLQLQGSTPVVVGELENVSGMRQPTPSFDIRGLDSNGDVVVESAINAQDGGVDHGIRVPFFASLALPRSATIADVTSFDVVTCGSQASGDLRSVPDVSLRDVEAEVAGDRVFVGGQAVAGNDYVEDSFFVFTAAYSEVGLFLGYDSEWVTTPLAAGQAYTLDLSIALFPSIDGSSVGSPASVTAWIASNKVGQSDCDDEPQSLELIDPTTLTGAVATPTS